MTDGGELVPLRTGFDVVLRGYRRTQVRAYVRSVEEELRLTAADRDANADLAAALTAEVEQLRAENARLARRLDEACRTPLEADAVPARLRRMVELAKEEAAEITARAQAAAEHSWAAAEDAAGRLRARYEDTLTKMDRERKEMQAEHRTLLQQARVDAAVMTTEADRRRTELDERAANRRAQVEADFEVAMARRRSDAMREIAERQQAARAEADRLLAEAKKDAARRVRVATEDATNRVNTAKADVARLRDLRGRVATQLRSAEEVLVGAGPLLLPVPSESDVLEEPARSGNGIPRQRASG